MTPFLIATESNKELAAIIIEKIKTKYSLLLSFFPVEIYYYILIKQRSSIEINMLKSLYLNAYFLSI